MPNLILHNGRITTLDHKQPEAQAVAIKNGIIQALGADRDIVPQATELTQLIDLKGRRVIPGLNDSHTHLIRGGLHYNMELRWDGVPSLAEALALLRQQADRTPPPQWVRVVGGWSEFQFAERRMPTLSEINQAAPDTPVFILHLYGRALLNAAALRVLAIDKTTPNPPSGVIEKDKNGNPTGMLIAKPSALILYSTLAKGPKLSFGDEINSTRHFMRELNRLGITSVIDAGGGGQNYPHDYQVIQHLHRQGQLTTRIAYNLFAQVSGKEHDDYARWLQMTQYGAGDEVLRMNGAGENLTWSAADFENFLEPRPDLAPIMEKELQVITRLLVKNRWPFRIHATYDESIDRFLGVFERVNREVPFDGLRFIIDHAETITDTNIERIKALGGGIATQHRMAYQGEYFVGRYGARAAEATPPIRKMLQQDLPVGAGTDATRVASYNPWIALYWLSTGRTLGGLQLFPAANRLDRNQALVLWTHGSAWFSGEEHVKGRLCPGQYADLAVLSSDYLSVAEEDIKAITSVLTVMGGNIVYADAEFSRWDPPIPPASPDWSPVNKYGGYWRATNKQALQQSRASACQDGNGQGCALHGHHQVIVWNRPIPVSEPGAFWGALGCSCFAP
jgi:predicted amidohydrolase YtcJ